ALVEDFVRLAPFGPGNPEPVVALAGVRAERPMAMKGGHIGLSLTDETGARLRAIAWRAQDTALGEMLLSGAGGLSVAGRLKPDDYRGAGGVQLEIEDASDPRRIEAA
ncbi:MAG: single-stranded-DNA-specific exonuclease RecJ, partial [Alphaproteobacteria bacterium]